MGNPDLYEIYREARRKAYDEGVKILSPMLTRLLATINATEERTMGKRTYTKEADVKAEVKKLLKQRGWMYWMPPGGPFGAGNADFNALRGGVFLAIETKFGGRKPTPLQLKFLNGVSSQDGFAFVVDEKRLGDLEQWLDAFDHSIAATQAGGQPAPQDGAAMLDAIAKMQEEMIADLAKLRDEPDEEEG